jgi:hypothetical protein
MGDRPNRDIMHISWFVVVDGGDPRDERLVDDERRSGYRKQERDLDAKQSILRHIRDRIAQSALCVCAGFAHPAVLLHQSNVSTGAVRTFGS